MPPRIRLRSLAQLIETFPSGASNLCSRCQYATAAATVPAPSLQSINATIPNIPGYDPRVPPSHRDPKYRKSQLIRSYVSLIQSTPLILLFQHNNVRTSEWTSIRRELTRALQKVDEQLLAQSQSQDSNAGTPHLIASAIKFQVIKTTMFEPALRIVEYYKPHISPAPESSIMGMEDLKDDPSLTHALSKAAYHAANEGKHQHPLATVLTGNIAILTFPTVSPQHLKASLSILAPNPPKFPAPTRRANPTYHEPVTQDGLKKLLLLGARIDGQVFDMEGTRWVGGIEGGIDGLRAQLVNVLQMFGVSLASTLQAAGKSLWVTMESRRKDMEEKEGGGGVEKKDGENKQ